MVDPRLEIRCNSCKALLGHSLYHQGRLHTMICMTHATCDSLVGSFQNQDSAGKISCIRRILAVVTSNLYVLFNTGAGFIGSTKGTSEKPQLFKKYDDRFLRLAVYITSHCSRPVRSWRLKCIDMSNETSSKAWTRLADGPQVVLPEIPRGVIGIPQAVKMDTVV